MSKNDALTDEQIRAEEKFLEGIPRLNVGALFLPPIWGPAHGIWATIVFYPLWLIADNCFYAAWSAPSALSIALAVLVFAMLTAGTVAFAIVSQPFAAHRAVSMGKTKQEYLAREKVWAVACVVVGVAMICLATYYNLVLRAGMEGAAA